MFCFLETDIKEQKKYEKKMQTSVDNINDLRYEIMFENVRDVRNVAFFFETKIYFILGDIFFKVPKNLILGIFFAEVDTKKHRYAPAKTSNAALVKLND